MMGHKICLYGEIIKITPNYPCYFLFGPLIRLETADCFLCGEITNSFRMNYVWMTENFGDGVDTFGVCIILAISGVHVAS